MYLLKNFSYTLTLMVVCFLVIVVASMALFAQHYDTSNNYLYEDIYIEENGQLVPFVCVSNDYNGGILLLRKYILDDFQPASDYLAKYEGSKIDNYLTTEYRNTLSESVKKSLLSVDVDVTSEDALYKAENKTYCISRSVFLLSYTEVNYSQHPCASNEGEALSYFGNADRNKVARKSDDTPCSWLLRTPYTGYESVVWTVGGDGKKTPVSADIENGVRPAICLSPDIQITKSHVDGLLVYVLN